MSIYLGSNVSDAIFYPELMLTDLLKLSLTNWPIDFSALRFQDIFFKQVLNLHLHAEMQLLPVKSIDFLEK